MQSGINTTRAADPSEHVPSESVREGKRGFRPFLAVSVVIVVSVLISRWAVWYGNEVSIPRYCAEPERAVESLRAAMEGVATTDAGSRREAMVAAKILFLIPRESGETAQSYFSRVRLQLELRCR